MKTNKFNVIIFSKDRALQLDATIKSFLLHCEDNLELSIYVLYCASDVSHEESYRRLIDENLNINFIRERDFKNDFISCLKNSSYVMFLVDDNIFVQDFRAKDVVDALNSNRKAIGFSLRLGKNTNYSYPYDSSQKIPEFKYLDNDILAYDWTEQEYDFGYPLELSSSVYRTDELVILFEKTEFSNPNKLEQVMDASKKAYASLYPFLLCYSQSKTFCNPVNMVQELFAGNRVGQNFGYSSYALLESFEKGYRIDVDSYSGFVPISCHQEVELKLKQLAPNYYMEKNEKLVSVIIPCYNLAEFLEEAVDSVVAQTYKNWECIIVNDGSTDNSFEVAENIVQKYSTYNIKAISQVNSGVCVARNTGIKKSKGEYILPFDADDKLHPNMLRETAALLDAEADVAIAYTDVQRFGDVNVAYNTDEYDFALLCEKNIISNCSLFRREAWETVGGYDTADIYGYEDWDFWISCGEKGFYGKRIPKKLFFYRVRKKTRLTALIDRDLSNKANLILRHSKLYGERFCGWAREILAQKKIDVTEKGSKVLVVVHNFPPTRFAGVELYTYEFVKELSAKGYDVSVLYPLTNLTVDKPYINLTQVETYKIYNIVSAAKGSLTAQLTDPEIEEVFGNLLIEEKFDVIHFQHILGMPVSFVEQAKQSGAVVCATLHDFWYICSTAHLYDYQSGKLCGEPESAQKCAKCLLSSKVKGLNEQQIEGFVKAVDTRMTFMRKMLTDNVDYCCAPTQFLKDIYVRQGYDKDKIATCSLGLAFDLKGVPKKENKELVFGFLGSMNSLKNAVFSANAFSKVKGSARFDFYGGGIDSFVGQLKDIISTDDRMTYKGVYTPDQLEEIFSGIDVLVVPSLMENFPLIVREAFMAKVPVIASNVGGIPEIIENGRNGLLFDPCDQDSLASVLQKIIDNPNLLDGFKNNIPQIKTMSQDVDEWVLRYEELLSEKSKKEILMEVSFSELLNKKPTLRVTIDRIKQYLEKNKNHMALKIIEKELLDYEEGRMLFEKLTKTI